MMAYRYWGLGKRWGGSTEECVEDKLHENWKTSPTLPQKPDSFIHSPPFRDSFLIFASQQSSILVRFFKECNVFLLGIRKKLALIGISLAFLLFLFQYQACSEVNR